MKTVLVRTAGAVLLLTAAAVAEAQEPGIEAVARFNAQHRPRVALFEFDDANTEAEKEGYAATVEAMLVTVLQKSQFVVVERQKLDGLYKEKRRIQQGLVDPEGEEASELLKKADAFILGSVTLIDATRVEIDTKLFSGFDGQVVAAAQRSGPVACLRSIVERLGTELEQEFLRPYQGSMELRLASPENVRIFLTPISVDTAPDQEQVAAERSYTVRIGNEVDTVEPWITNPTSYTIKNLLSGRYSLRLARPGYEDLKMDTGRFEVRVVPQATGIIDGDALGFTLHRKGGSLALRVKRQYLDKDFTRTPQRVILMGGKGLDLNASEPARQPDGDPKCDLLRELPPLLPNQSRTIVAPGQTFDFSTFQGGELVIEDYRGETVPTGQYQLTPWDAHYKIEKSGVIVRDGDGGKVVQRNLARETLPLTLKTTGAHSKAYQVILEGRETQYRRKLPLHFTDAKENGLPADTYKVSTNVPGLDRWKRTFDHFPGNAIPPRYHLRSSAYKPEVTNPYEDKPEQPLSLIVKTRFVLAGRLEVLSRTPEPRSSEHFIDDELGNLLDRLFYELETKSGAAGEIRQLLIEHLEVIDLLLLNPRDMARLRQSPETVAIVQDYVKKGGALFAFVSEPGDYSAIVGAPLVLEIPDKGFTKRPSLKFSPESWRVIAFAEGSKEPRVLERADKKPGGYVALWLDDSVSFRNRSGRTIPKVQETRGTLEERVFKWARYLMYRRYDKAGKLRKQAEEALLR